ncbi:ribose-5-phosphate isomerase RpiA [Sphingomonas bacterium]|uniref:ribose-5-phosphate isomerase RpiA n=1 Tax=Sphingomonas bacterium TaxID=1895847 RepID=UPI0015773B84|nr:ribose-5-phosphate isomerase RpiA [Sphingomonas bacterium]
MNEQEKRAAALAATAEIVSGMTLGLGTGSTAAYVIAQVGERFAAGLVVRVVATSLATERAARAAGIMVADFADIAVVDLTIDGADEIDDRFFAVKGGGGAMVREKIVAAASRRMVVVADSSKLVARIGKAKLPVEVLPFARAYAAARLTAIGADVVLRKGADGTPFRSDQGNFILDAHSIDLSDPVAAAAAIDAIPGVVGHGLFLSEVSALYVATGDVVTRLERQDKRG